ncbi:MAG: hypothetical protein H5T64_10155 [Chloroflexi bacterium]|nr:hypothetical protein [Chloroflexota bacterium]
MGEKMNLGQFYNFLRTARRRIADVYREIEEVQYQFNDLYASVMQNWQEQASACLTILQQQIEKKSLPPSLAAQLEGRLKEEREKFDKEVADLCQRVAAQRDTAHAALMNAQDQIAALRKSNPELNAREEELKARRVSLETELAAIQNNINRLNSFPVGWIRNAGAIRQLRQQHAALQKNLEGVITELRAVRQEWQERKMEAERQQAQLKADWQAASIEAAQLQAQLDALVANQEAIVLRRAAEALLVEMKEVPPDAGELSEPLQKLVELNTSREGYQRGLTSVAEVLGLLKGLGEGMDRFITSVSTVFEEQRRYQLPDLEVDISKTVADFHNMWGEFQSKVKDEKYLGARPLEFSERIHYFIKAKLTEETIERMFEDLGASLNAATKAWDSKDLTGRRKKRGR